MKENEIIEKYLAKTKNAEIYKEYNISRYTLLNIIKENNIPLKQVQCFLDENFFEEINTEEKAYWLGFFYADGYLVYNKQYGIHGIGIELSSKDKNHLEK